MGGGRNKDSKQVNPYTGSHKAMTAREGREETGRNVL